MFNLLITMKKKIIKNNNNKIKMRKMMILIKMNINKLKMMIMKIINPQMIMQFFFKKIYLSIVG